MVQRHLLVSLSVAFVTSVLACSSDTQATPRVIFDSNVFAGSHPTSGCGETGTWFTIGSFGNPSAGHVNPQDPNSDLVDPPVPVDDGGNDQQGTVSATCTVKANGDNFDLALTAQLTGATGGSVTITGTIPPTGTDSQPNVTVNVTRMGQTFAAKDCVVSYDTTLGHAVAAGRVWANFDCADANQSVSSQLCESQGTFRFENCGQ